MYRLLTLIKKTVGKSKAGKSKSLHSMTMINVVSAMTKEICIVIIHYRNEFSRNHDHIWKKGSYKCTTQISLLFYT